MLQQFNNKIFNKKFLNIKYISYRCKGIEKI